MTTERVLLEARRRWGPDAVLCNGRDGEDRCLLGVFVRDHFFVKASGRTWAEALRNADAEARCRCVPRLSLAS